MKNKPYLIAFLVSFFFISSYSEDTLIDISPYASGEIIIPYDIATQNQDINMWYRDTTSFSSGIRITVMELNQMITRNYLAYGGLVFIDTLSSVNYKFHESLEKVYEQWDPSNLGQGMFTITINNPDTKWNDALHFPDSLAPCDTFIRIVDFNPDNPIFTKARCIYRTWWYIGEEINKTSNMPNYNGIIYVKPNNNMHMKMQISEFQILEKEGMNGTNYYPDTIKLLWAVDSAGNGMFKHDPVLNKHIIPNKNTPHKKAAFLSIKNNIPYLHISSPLIIEDEQISIT